MGVFIAGGSTTRWCKFPVLPFNRHNYRIFRGFPSNITSTAMIVDYSWTDKWTSLTSRPSPPNVPRRAFGLDFRHVGHSFPLRLANFALHPSPSSQVRVVPYAQIWGLRSVAFAAGASLHGLRWPVIARSPRPRSSGLRVAAPSLEGGSPNMPASVN